MSNLRRADGAGRPTLLASAAIAAAFLLAACGGGASPSSSPPASVAPPASTVPSMAPSVAPSSAPSVAPSSAPSVARSAATVDAAAGVQIAAPYSLTALPTELQAAMESQMAASLGGFGGSITFGFRQIGGGSGQGVLMVIGFPAGSLTEAAYAGALAAMGSSMGTTLTSTTVEGVAVSTGAAGSGSIALFPADDNLILVIVEKEADTLPMTTALIRANK